MKLKNSNSSFKTTAALILLITCPSSTQAAPGTLSDVPLYIGTTVEPNIVFLSDDSASMDFEILTTDHDNMGTFDGWTYTGTVVQRDTVNCENDTEPYKYIIRRNIVLPTGHKHCEVAADENWRARNSDFNKLYYDPTKTYTPWKGVNALGQEYENASITAAPFEPYTYDFTSTPDMDRSFPDDAINLTNSDSLGELHASGFRYYTWTDTDGDGNFDDGEQSDPIFIASGTAEEKTNFANWFTYHRKREYAFKYALSTATSDITGVRVGHATINQNATYKADVASLNLSPSAGNKKALFDAIFKINTTPGDTNLDDMGTIVNKPLKTALNETGKFFDCTVSGDGIFSSDCPILSDAEGGSCQRNVTIMLTDGYYEDEVIGVGDIDGDGALNTLADIAKKFYDNDLDTTLTDEVPPYGSDTNAKQHMNTYSVALGASGNIDTTQDPSTVTWPNPTITTNEDKLKDLWHAAVNGLGEFYNAQNPNDLSAAMTAAVTSASKGSSTAASVAFNTTTLDADSVVYQARFNPSEDWKGELTATELNANGELAGSPTWNAGDILDEDFGGPDNHSSRVIYTYKRSLLTSAGIPFNDLSTFSATQKADLNMGPSGPDGKGAERLMYLRGDDSNESAGDFFRDRTNILGDIVHSNPVFVGKPQHRYPNADPFGIDGDRYSDFIASITDPTTGRNGVVYVGANDGMLHGFNEDGSEVMAYIPNALFSAEAGKGLHYLTDPDYSHRYYVDLSPTVADVYLNNSDWKTVLVGGLRAGGRGLFALDVTRPDLFTDANAGNIVLWEFDSSDDADLGYTFSKPTIALMENDRWAAIVGNGYNNTGTGTAQLFILFLDGGLDGVWTYGTDYLKIDTEVGSIANPNGLSTPAVADTDGDGRADRAYAGDLLGNLWAFDLTGNSGGWDVDSGGGSPSPMFTATNALGTPQAITSKPIIARQTLDVDGGANLMVFFGTGQYLVDGDKTTTGGTHQQSFYGVWDDGSDSLTRDDLTEQPLNTSGSVRTTNDPAAAIPYDNDKKGWYHDLDTNGERVIVDPKIRGNFVFYNTLIPGTENCEPQGSGWLMAVRQYDGSMSTHETFDVNKDGRITTDDGLAAGVKLDNIPAGSNFLGDVMYTPDDEGNVDARKVDAGISVDSGRLSWEQLVK